MALTLLLCDDHQLFREGLTALLRQQRPEWQVVGQASDGAGAIRLAAALRPDLAVLDLAMPGVGGCEAAAAIRACSPDTRIVALSMHADADSCARMLAAGAAAYVLKNEAGADLIAAITAVLRGETFVSPLPASAADQPSPRGDGARPQADAAVALTAREREVLALIARGRRTREIAASMQISIKTVETYRGRLLMKLGTDNVAGLIKYAIRTGLAPVD